MCAIFVDVPFAIGRDENGRYIGESRKIRRHERFPELPLARMEI